MTNESTNYNDWSNSEINHAVARAVDGLHNHKNTAIDCYVSGGIVREQVRIWSDEDGEWYSKNYCNNPSDAWPIIVENNIAVVPYRHTLPCAWPTAFGMTSKFTTEDKNPLRAAMIVFLMMKDAKVC